MYRQSHDYGLMTLDEYLTLRNPKKKYHESGSYTFSVDSMNEDFSIIEYRLIEERESEYKVYGKNDKSAFFFCKGGKVRAVVANGTIYYSYTREKDHLLSHPLSRGHAHGYIYLRDMGLREKKVKYPSEYLGLVSNIVKRNQERYPHLLERFENRGETFTVRSESPLTTKNAGVAIGIFNEQGYKVATAQDEWGATLIGVAEEYRSRGLSKIVARYWYEANPDKESGGMTPEGYNAAVSFWADRVREKLEEGAYKEMILRGEITQERVDQILEKLPKKEIRKIEVTRKIEPTGELLMWADHPSFVVYDRAWLVSQEDRFIYGHGFLREAPNVGSFFYSLDYDRPYADIVTRIALQFAKDNGDARLFDGYGDRYSDILEVEDISEVSREGDYLVIDGDTIDYTPLVERDRTYRKRIDKYGELEATLIENAESKWK